MTALRGWYAPEQRAVHPDTELAHHLGNRVMILAEELREVRDENTRLRRTARVEQEMYLRWVTDLSDEVLRLTLLLLSEREARREASDAER